MPRSALCATSSTTAHLSREAYETAMDAQSATSSRQEHAGVDVVTDGGGAASPIGIANPHTASAGYGPRPWTIASTNRAVAAWASPARWLSSKKRKRYDAAASALPVSA
jgi:hypothetical protein